MALLSGTLAQTLDLEKFLHGTSTIASVLNLDQPTTIASLPHWTSTFCHSALTVLHTGLFVALRLVRTVVQWWQYFN